MSHSRRFARAIFVAACLLLPPCLVALINPNFTIVDLFNASTTVQVLELGPVADERITARVTGTIKGDSAGAEVVFVITEDEKAKMVASWLKTAGNAQPAVLFTGVDGDPEVGFVEIGSTWVKCTREMDGVWNLEDDDRDLETVWAGSARTLVSAVRYVEQDSHPDFPVQEETVWSDERRLGQLAGPAHGLLAVDLGGDASRCMIALSAGGDRAWRLGSADAGSDLTEALGLASTSHHLVAADFTGDGRTDLVSWDGAALALQVQGENGRLAMPIPGPSLAAMQSLEVTRLADGRPGLVAGLATGIALMAVAADGKIKAVPPPPPVPHLGALGAGGACLAADVDGDGRTDLLQLFTGGFVFYAGTAGAPGFAAPTVTAVPLPADSRSACFGDFDGDGRLDLFVLGGRHFVLLCRDQQGGWLEVTPETGELAVSQPRNNDAGGLVAAAPIDLNGDGRLGIAVFNAKAPPSLFFNRGFACFGLSRKMAKVYEEEPDLRCMAAGVQAGTIVDLDEDGTPDACIVDPAGAVWLVRTRTDKPRRFRLTLSPPSDAVGPITVAVTQGERPLGMYLVRPAEQVTLVLPKAGPVDLHWHQPDGAPAELKMVVAKPTTAVLTPKP